MKKSILIAVAAVVVIVVVAAGVLVCYNPFAGQPTATPTPPPNEADVAEDARDSAVMFITTNHTEVAPMLSNMTWTGGRVETGLVGSETHIWTSGNWNVTITHPVVPDPVYTIGAVYTDTVNNVTVDWQGTYQNGVVTETNYSFVVPP